ncbi:MAG: ATP-binding protein [Treponema sp.]|nr:ATP-binding protein [Treponema sp.]
MTSLQPARISGPKHMLLSAALIGVMALGTLVLVMVLSHRAEVVRESAILENFANSKAIALSEAIRRGVSRDVAISLIVDSHVHEDQASINYDYYLITGDRRGFTVLNHRNEPEHQRIPENRMPGLKPFLDSAAGRQGVYIGPAQSSHRIVAAYYPVPELGAGLVAIAPLAQSDDEFFRNLGLLCISVAVLFTLILFLFYSYSKRASRDLVLSERKFETLLESSYGGIIVYDPRFKVLYRNEAAFAAHDICRHEGGGGEVSGGRVVDDQGRGLGFDQLPAARALRTGVKVGPTVIGIRHGMGIDWNLVTAMPLKDHRGEVEAVMMTFYDYNPMHRIQEALRRSNDALAKAQSFAKLGSWSWNIADRRVEVSDEMGALLALARDELGADPIGSILARVHPEDRAELAAAFRSFAEGAAPRPLECRVALPDERARDLWCEVGEVLLGENGKPAILSGFAQDITQRREAEREASRNQRLLIQSEKLASIGALVAGVAHEISNPNHTIRLNASVLADIWNSGRPVLQAAMVERGGGLLGGLEYAAAIETAPRLFRGIENASGHIARIVGGLRDFSRPDDEKSPERAELNEVVAAALSILQPFIRESTERFRFVRSPAPLVARGKFYRLEQVVINLVQNACQALTDPSQSVVVAIARAEGDAFIGLEVRDEGRGMSEEVLGRIRDPFFTTKSGQGGLGLGVSISAAIVEECGGRLEYRSTPGAGTTARLLLPPASEAAAEKGIP